jgi:arylsulfatase A-like enzyme
MYDPDEVELPPNFMGGHPFDMGNLHGRDESLAGFPRTPRETRRHIAEYYAMISHLDYEVGRILGALDERGLTDNTVIVYAGDNGLALGQHGLFGKQNCYDHSVRVPLIFAGPGIPEDARTDAYAYLLDIFPTLCELTGLQRPASVEGRSLMPVIHDPATQVRDSLYFAFVALHRAVKDDRYKLIEYCVGGRHNMTQLFDLAEDPWELHNLAGDPAHAAKLAELREQLVQFRDEWGDRATEWGQKFWGVYGSGPCAQG